MACSVFAEEKKSADIVHLKTNKGEIVIELNREKAPITVENFVSYVNKKHYDGTIFHRVINGFMIQGGGFEKKADGLVEKETGKEIKNEGSNGLKNLEGTIAMARKGDPNSATAQFFINVKDNTMLDAPNPDGHGYAVFGKVIKGMDVVNEIKGVKTSQQSISMKHNGEAITVPAGDVPVDAIVIEKATMEKASEAAPTKEK